MLLSQEYCSETNVQTGFSTDVVQFFAGTIASCFKAVISNSHWSISGVNQKIEKIMLLLNSLYFTYFVLSYYLPKLCSS